jgi:hypothetical protein
MNLQERFNREQKQRVDSEHKRLNGEHDDIEIGRHYRPSNIFQTL